MKAAYLRILFALSCLGLLAGGCAHYQLAGESALPFRKLYIEPVKNASFAPQAQALVSQELADAFLRDGQLKLVDIEADADAVLTVNLLQYERQLSATRRADTGVGRSFNLELTALVQLTDTETGKAYIKGREFRADQIAFTDSGTVDAEYQTMPLIARELAGDIKDAIIGIW